MAATEMQFFRAGDGVLARKRHPAAVPEVWGEMDRSWAPYPGLDELHDARPVSTKDAMSVPSDPVSMGDLQSTGDTGNFGDIYESAAPLKRVLVRGVVR